MAKYGSEGRSSNFINLMKIYYHPFRALHLEFIDFTKLSPVLGLLKSLFNDIGLKPFGNIYLGYCG
jgi:hypothetical protein